MSDHGGRNLCTDTQNAYFFDGPAILMIVYLLLINYGTGSLTSVTSKCHHKCFFKFCYLNTFHLAVKRLEECIIYMRHINTVLLLLLFIVKPMSGYPHVTLFLFLSLRRSYH